MEIGHGMYFRESEINMKKILVIITTEFVPYGGLTSVMMNYYRFLDESEFHVDFASTNKDVDLNLQEELSSRHSKYYCIGNRKKNPIKYVGLLKRILRNEKYDIIHINSNSATAMLELYAAKKCGIQKRIVHNHTSICDHRVIHNLLYPFFKRSYTDAIACSEKAGNWIFGKRQFTIINNGIIASNYMYSEEDRNYIRKKYRISDSTVVIGHLGKIYKPKNHHFLISVYDAYKKLDPDSKLLLVGDGEMRKEIERDVNDRQLRDNVIFAGMQHDTSKFLSAMDIFVFPSIWEGMPLSAIEAQASGLTCIISENIDSGVCVTPSVKTASIDNGIEIWTNLITKAAKEKYERKNVSKSNIELIRNAEYDVYKNAEKLRKIYLEEETVEE